MRKLSLFTIILFCFSATAQDSSKAIYYNPDAGLQFKKGDFQWSTWAYAERLFSPSQKPAWRRVRQGMEFQLPSYPFKIIGKLSFGIYSSSTLWFANNCYNNR